MANMSYCRFENTLKDLRDCRNALLGQEGVDALSESEKRAAMRLIRICQDIVDLAGLRSIPYSNPID